jgi:uncharacterized membrane protein YjgN (DUF898 family)
MATCPACGHETLAGDRCARCGAAAAATSPFARPPVARLSPFARPPAAAAPPVGPAEGAPARPVAAPEPPIAASRRFSFHGTGASLFGVHVVNAFLTLATLGVYYFWAKTKIRSWTLSHAEFEGDRFAYHGTGGELFVGFLKALGILFVPAALLNLLPELLDAPAEVRSLAGLLGSLLVILFIPVAWVGARRYRLSRTSWRGIRFSFRGRVRDFVWLFVSGVLLSFLTFGVYYPFFVTRRQAFLVSHSWFGSARFAFDGNGRHLLGPFLGSVLLLPFTLGLSWFWFLAARHRLFVGHTTFGQARFASGVTAPRLAWLIVSNLLLVLVTVGLAWPWARVRAIRFTTRWVSLEGPLDLTPVRQDARDASTTGEGLAGFFDTDLGLG